MDSAGIHVLEKIAMEESGLHRYEFQSCRRFGTLASFLPSRSSDSASIAFSEHSGSTLPNVLRYSRASTLRRLTRQFEETRNFIAGREKRCCCLEPTPSSIKREAFDYWRRRIDPSFRSVLEELRRSLQEIKLVYDSKQVITRKSVEYFVATASQMGETELVNAVAIASFLKGRVKEAETIFHSLLESSPNHPRMLNNLAVLYYESCEYRKSRQLVEQILSVQTDDIELINNVNALLLRLDKISGCNAQQRETLGGPAREMKSESKSNFRYQTSGRSRISVITPSFNQAGYIEQNIRSVLDQQYPDFEHIVIDGGSTDGTVEVLKRFPHLKWISEKDNGQSDALNKGFAMASGDIICWLNSDDWLAPEAFHRVAHELASGRKISGHG